MPSLVKWAKRLTWRSPGEIFSIFPALALLYIHFIASRADHWVAACLVPLAFWVFLNGLDDLVLDLACACSWLAVRLSRRAQFRRPSEAELDAAPQKRIAVFVPLWKEHRVIQKMVEHNIAANRYRNWDIFIGAYPNDAPTLAAIREARKQVKKVHLAVCPHDGPTSKADNLNWIYQRMLLMEEEEDVHFDIIMTHDAEDIIHPDSLRWINYFGEKYDMVQVPVLALPTPTRELTHGVYCDEFAEFQMKDLRARQVLGGFIPSCGVGTGFKREALEKLAAAHSNRIFEPVCLTEDYENGFRMHRLGCPQFFIPVYRSDTSFVATREYFPRKFRAAVRQRTRWITGIALQSWQRHGWRDTATQLYWFWRDRKGLIGNLAAPLANLLFLYGALTWLWSARTHTAWGLAQVAQNPFLRYAFFGTLGLQLFHMLIRGCCSARVYGWRFALGVPLRAIWGNWINCFATVMAYYRYFSAVARGRPLVWLKTEHAYPNRAALVENKRKLGEVLVGSQYLAAEELEAALTAKPATTRLGDYLIQHGKLSEADVYEALSLQQNVPFGKPEADAISRPVTRSLPADVAKRWKVLPYKVAAGHLFVAGSELPSDQMHDDLRKFSSLEIRFHLVTPTEFEELAHEYLPQ
ncbi:MAG TPA: glycosyl transferase family protein [Bryobacteraceae bacterium]|nr:glycosyl transferase family protein [Bryobacteraceae bacterium]